MAIKFQPLRLNSSDLLPDSWCDLFDLSANDVMGIALYFAVQNPRRQRKQFFYIADIIDEIAHDPKVHERTTKAIVNRFEMARDWDIISTNNREVWEIFDLQCD